MLRDLTMFDFAKKLGLDYVPAAKLANLFINGFYNGTYTVTTKVKGNTNGLTMNSGDFLICLGNPNSENSIGYDHDYRVNIIKDDSGEYVPASYVELVYPKPEEATKQTNEYVRSIFQNYVDILEGRKEGKLSDVIDLESFAKFYWVQELSMNVDAWCRSDYMYYRKDTGKLYAGPVWDFEFTFNSGMNDDMGNFTTPEDWMVRNKSYYIPLFENEEFVAEVERVYREYDIPKLMDETVEEFTVKAEELSDIGNIHYLNSLDDNNYYLPSDYGIISPYDNYTKDMVEFMSERFEWIKEEMY